MDPARAIEENGAEFLLALGHAARAEVRDASPVRWTIGNCPIGYHNAVVHADLPLEDADREIEASLGLMRSRGVSGSRHVRPSMRPSNLGGRLLSHGFEPGGDDVGMAADLSTLPDQASAPEEFVVERVRDEDGLAVWVEPPRIDAARGPGNGPGRYGFVA